MSAENVQQDIVTYHVFIKNGYRHYAPQYFAAFAQWVFPIAKSNAIGTLDECGNCIESVSFGKYGVEPERDSIVKNISGIDGPFDYQFCSNFSEERIAYSTTKSIVIGNIKIGMAFHAKYASSIDDYMRCIRFLNPQQDLFMIVKSIYDVKDGWNDYLYISKLDGEEFIDINQVMKLGKTGTISSDIPLHNRWLVHDKNLFVSYRDTRDEIICMDGSGQNIFHPFVEAFKRNFGIGSKYICPVLDFAIHPTLPFGVIIEDSSYDDIRHRLVVVRWDVGKIDKQIEIYCDELEKVAHEFGIANMELAYSSFSPFGSWYIVGCISSDDPKAPHFIAFPIITPDKKRPTFLDWSNVAVLGQIKNMTSLAWTHYPTSFVTSNGELLHKWDLDELANASVFVMPEEDDGKKKSIFRRVGGLLGGRK